MTITNENPDKLERDEDNPELCFDEDDGTRMLSRMKSLGATIKERESTEEKHSKENICTLMQARMNCQRAEEDTYCDSPAFQSFYDFQQKEKCMIR